MSKGGTDAMRQRLLGAVGQDMEPGYGLSTPAMTVDKALALDAFIRGISTDIYLHAAVLGVPFVEAWKAFAQSWIVQLRQLQDAGTLIWLPGTMEMLLEKETMARRFRATYEQRTGLRSTVPDVPHRLSFADQMGNVADRLQPFAIPTVAIVGILAVVGVFVVVKTL